jgi:hypothetical protein
MIDTRTLRTELTAWLTAGGFNAYGRIQQATLPAVFIGQPVSIRPFTGGLDELRLELVVMCGNPSDPDTQDLTVELAYQVLNRFRPATVDMSAFTVARSISASEVSDFGETSIPVPALTGTVILAILG